MRILSDVWRFAPIGLSVWDEALGMGIVERALPGVNAAMQLFLGQSIETPKSGPDP